MKARLKDRLTKEYKDKDEEKVVVEDDNQTRGMTSLKFNATTAISLGTMHRNVSLERKKKR